MNIHTADASGGMLQMSVNNVSPSSPFHCSKVSLPPGTWPEELSVCQTPGCLSRTHLGLLGSHGYQSCSLKTLQRRNQFPQTPRPDAVPTHAQILTYVHTIYIHIQYVRVYVISYTYSMYTASVSHIMYARKYVCVHVRTYTNTSTKVLYNRNMNAMHTHPPTTHTASTHTHATLWPPTIGYGPSG